MKCDTVDRDFRLFLQFPVELPLAFWHECFPRRVAEAAYCFLTRRPCKLQRTTCVNGYTHHVDSQQTNFEGLADRYCSQYSSIKSAAVALSPIYRNARLIRRSSGIASLLGILYQTSTSTMVRYSTYPEVVWLIRKPSKVTASWHFATKGISSHFHL